MPKSLDNKTKTNKNFMTYRDYPLRGDLKTLHMFRTEKKYNERYSQGKFRDSFQFLVHQAQGIQKM